MKKEKGITLIALVITVIILIILSTVTLNVVLGEGGLIQRAQEAKDLTEQAAFEEQQELNSLMSEMANIMSEEPEIPEPPEEHKHSYKEGVYESDETQHWQICTKCNEKGNIANHDEAVYEYDGNNHWKTCSTCGYEYDKKAHQGSTLYQNDDTYHYWKCDICGAEYNKDTHDFEWVIDKEATVIEHGMRHQECMTCGYAKPSESYQL